MRAVFILLTFFITCTALGQSPLSADDLKILQAQIKAEEQTAEPLQYRQRWSVQKNAAGEWIQTPYLIVIFPGLFDSPAHVVDLHNFLVRSFRQNTVTVRLRGHYDKTLPMKNSRHEDWLEGFLEQEKSWRPLGQKLVFIGHSTGGVLAVHFAQQYEKETAAVVALAPAIDQSLRTKAETYFGSLIGYDKWEPETGRRKVARLGFEVQDLSAKVQKDFRLGAALTRVPVLTIDSASDDTVVPRATKELFQSKIAEAARIHIVLPKKLKITHREVRQHPVHVKPQIAKFLKAQM